MQIRTIGRRWIMVKVLLGRIRTKLLRCYQGRFSRLELRVRDPSRAQCLTCPWLQARSRPVPTSQLLTPAPRTRTYWPNYRNWVSCSKLFQAGCAYSSHRALWSLSSRTQDSSPKNWANCNRSSKADFSTAARTNPLVRTLRSPRSSPSRPKISPSSTRSRRYLDYGWHLLFEGYHQNQSQWRVHALLEWNCNLFILEIYH